MNARLIATGLIASGALCASVAAQGARHDRPVFQRLQHQSKDWRLTSEVLLEGDARLHYNAQRLTTETIDVERAVLVFPVAPVTAISSPRTSSIEGTLRSDGGVIDDSVRLLDGYASGARLVAFDSEQLVTKTLRMTVHVPMRSWETRVDDRRALEIMWPGEPIEALYPEEALSALLPERYIESDAPAVQNLLTEWTGGDPKILRPYALAKHLAGKVVNAYQPQFTRFRTEADLHSDAGQRYRITTPVAGTYLGINVDGALSAAQRTDGRINVLDMPNLLCALYRAAGIPARVVVGFDTRSERDPEGFPAIVAWVEFYLWDNVRAEGHWIPVDVIRQREFGSIAPPITQAWKFFGTIEDAEHLCPLSLHWHPPTFVMNEGAPLLWGWLPTPGEQRVNQRLRFYATDPGRRGDDEPFDGEDR